MTIKKMLLKTQKKCEIIWRLPNYTVSLYCQTKQLNFMKTLDQGKRALLCNHPQFIAQLPLDGIDAIISGNKITKVVS